MSGWVVDDNNRLTSDGTHSYLYDQEGNRTRKTTIATGDYVEYEWDHRNRLTDVRFKNSAGTLTKHVRYSYDPANRLVRRQVDSNGDGTFDQSEAFVYDGADMVLVFNGTGSLTHRFLPDAATDALFADEDALGEILWNLTDHQGTVRDVADYDAATDTTNVVNHLQYGSFGTITSQSNTAYEAYVAYTGMYRDPITGLQKHGQRWFDPDAMRWLSEDPIGFAAGDANVFRYVGNSPANFTDPTGLSARSWQGPIAEAEAAQAATVAQFVALQAEYARIEMLKAHATAGRAHQMAVQQTRLYRQMNHLYIGYHNRAVSISSMYTSLRWEIAERNRRRALERRPPLPQHTGSYSDQGQWELDMAEAHRQRMGQFVGQAVDTLDRAVGAGVDSARDAALAAAGEYVAAKTILWAWDKYRDARRGRIAAEAAEQAANAARRAPAPNNYRGRYMAELHGQGKPRLPDDWDVHHRIPQEYMNHPEFEGFDFHHPDNLRGVKGARSHENVHQRITNEWARFREAYEDATREQIEAYAEQIDQRFADEWHD